MSGSTAEPGVRPLTNRRLPRHLHHGWSLVLRLRAGGVQLTPASGLASRCSRCGFRWAALKAAGNPPILVGGSTSDSKTPEHDRLATPGSVAFDGDRDAGAD